MSHNEKCKDCVRKKRQNKTVRDKSGGERIGRIARARLTSIVINHRQWLNKSRALSFEHTAQQCANSNASGQFAAPTTDRLRFFCARYCFVRPQRARALVRQLIDNYTLALARQSERKRLFVFVCVCVRFNKCAFDGGQCLQSDRMTTREANESGQFFTKRRNLSAQLAFANRPID